MRKLGQRINAHLKRLAEYEKDGRNDGPVRKPIGPVSDSRQERDRIRSLSDASERPEKPRPIKRKPQTKKESRRNKDD